jgi:hypothetical protein
LKKTRAGKPALLFEKKQLFELFIQETYNMFFPLLEGATKSTSYTREL